MWLFIIWFLLNSLVLEVIAKSDCKVRLQQCETRKPPPRKQVCGSDNQTYPNRCALLRVQCMHNSPLTVKHKGKCKERQPCWLDLAKKLNRNNGKEHRDSSDYIPTCLADGTYAPVQCHKSMGYCWCVTPNGTTIPRTTARHRRLECPRKGRPNMSPMDSDDDMSDSPKKGCDQTNKSIFVNNLVRIFKTEYNRDTFGKHNAAFPDNRSAVNLDEKAVQWKFVTLDRDNNGTLNKNEYRELRKLVKKVVKPRKCSRAFVRLCDADRNFIISRQEWTACLDVNTTVNTEYHNRPYHQQSSVEQLSSADAETDSEDVDLIETDSDQTSVLEGTLPLNDHSANDDKDLDGKVNDCLSDRKAVLDELKLGNQEMYVPECMPDGRYKKVQCYHSTGYCWCVLEDSGKPIPGTSVKDPNQPKCDTIQQLPRPMKGCPDLKKLPFIKNLLEFFHHNLTTKEYGDPTTVENNQEKHENSASLGFLSLDTNKNEILDRREWKVFRLMVSTNKTLKKCGRKFPRYCDMDRDNKITKSEWFRCLSLHRVNILSSTSGSHASTPITTRVGPNPLESLLKEDD